MEVSVRVFGHVIVEDDVDALDVHAPAKQVGGHQDASLEVLELLVARKPAGDGGGTRQTTEGQKHNVSDRHGRSRENLAYWWWANLKDLRKKDPLKK